MDVSMYPLTALEHIMSRRLLIGLVAACALAGWGCGDEPEPPASTARPPAQVPPVAAPDVEKPAVPSPAEQALISRAEQMLAQADQNIKDKDLDSARKAVDELVKMKDQLPAALQEEVDKVKKALDAATP